MFDIILKNITLTDLLSKHDKILSILINKGLYNYIEDEECVVLFNECVDLFCTLGLHYGHYVKRRKCENKFINGTQYSASLINIKISYANLLLSLTLLYKQLMNNKNVLFISKKSFEFLSNCKLPNFCLIKKWIGGTLTNSKYVLGSYKCKLYDSSCGYISLIYSLNPNSSWVLSKEVLAYNENSQNKVVLHMLSDTNMKFVYDSSIIPILLNDDSPYFKVFINHTMSKVFSLL